MKTLNSITESRVFIRVCQFGVFALMLLLNFLTHYYADDYAYMYSFQTGARIENLFAIFPSLETHYVTMNGRLTAHFFAQLFLMLPKFVFNVINAAMFCAMLILAMRLSSRDGRKNALVFIAMFCAVWVFQPAFGQVNLWLDGSVNYLWSVVFALLFLIPYLNVFEGRRAFPSIPAGILFVIFAFLVGGYSENTSSAVIAGAFLLLLAAFLWKKHRPGKLLVTSWVSACLGFAVMALSPAGIDKKVAAFELDILAQRFHETLLRLWDLKWLLIIWAILFILALLLSVKKERLFLSLAYLFTGFFANFILVFSTYYPPRSMCSVTVFIIISVFTLVWELYDKRKKTAVNLLALAAIAVSVIPFYNGGRDIWLTYNLCDEAYGYIAECKENGEYDISLPYIWGGTKYSAVNDLKYLDTEDPYTWPNFSMARYFEVDSIIGYYE